MSRSIRVIRCCAAVVLLLAGCQGELSSGVPPRPDPDVRILGEGEMHGEAPRGHDGSIPAPDAGRPDAAPSHDGGVPPTDARPTMPDADAMAPPTTDMCGDMRLTTRVHYGTAAPTFLDLAEGQILAIGMLQMDSGGGTSFCSGALIAPRYVLTAKHCAIRAGSRFMVGPDAEPDTVLTTGRWLAHPTNDIALIELTSDATVEVPGLVPIRVNVENADGWAGRTTEASGYGNTESGGIGRRLFSSLPIQSVDSQFFYFNGGGRGGVCNGDSGGPLMAFDSAGDVRVIGVVSGGDGTCTYEAHFTRADAVVDWIEGYTGPTPDTDGVGCGAITSEGRCIDGRAVWCASEEREVETCGTGEACGWDASANGYRCVPAASAHCDGLDAVGDCDGTTARWCERGVLRTRNCASCMEACGTRDGVAYCVPDACGGIEYLGECQGNVSVWCEGGELKRRDCGAEGRTCGYIDETTGWYCR